MSNYAANVAKLTDALWHALLRSYLKIATIAAIMMVLSGLAAFSLRHYANELAMVNTPITLVAGQLKASVEESISELRAWASINDVQFIKSRNEIWADKIYPALAELQQLDKGNEALTLIESELHDLEMWQWFVEDIAHTPSNFPANAYIKQTLDPVRRKMFSSINALLDSAIQNNEMEALKRLLTLRTRFYLADRELQDFIVEGQLYNADKYSQIVLSLVDDIEYFDFDKQSNNAFLDEQLRQLKTVFSNYKSLAKEAIILRQADDWNVSLHLLAETILPLEEKLNARLDVILSHEQLTTKNVADKVNVISQWLPFITVMSLLLMFYISYRIAKKERSIFIQPVIELERNKEWLDLILESSPVGVFTLNQAGLIQSINSATQQILGYSEQELVNKSVSTIKATAQNKAYLKDLLHQQKSSEKEGKELTVIRKDGSQIHLHMLVTKIKLDDEISFLCMITDITQMANNKQALLDANTEVQHALEKANEFSHRLMMHEERTHLIVEASLAGIITITTRGLIQSFNSAAERLFGYTAEEVMNKNVSMLMPTDNAKKHDGYLHNFLNTRDAKIIGIGREVVALRKDGSTFDMNLAVAEMESEEETLFLGMVTDISEQVAQREKILQSNEELQANSEELQAQQEELRVANEELIINSKALELNQEQMEEKAAELVETSRYKSEFMANMSHELRTPLNSLLILSGSLADNEEANLSKDEVESAKIIKESGQHLLELINEILDLSKTEAGKMVVENKKITLAVLSTALNSRFKHMAADKNIGFSIDIAEITVDLISDESKLNHILTNLISNAIKFTSQGEVKLTIKMMASPLPGSSQNKLFAFSVSDTGIGIAKENQALVFEAFQQADGSTSRHYGGTGLGLSLVQSYSKLLGGAVQLESELGQGSTFTLFLPEAFANENSNNEASLEPHHEIAVELKNSPPPFEDDREQLQSNKPLFLIIEDDEKFAKILFETCHQQQSQALVAPDGETGITLAKHYPITGIILDYMLPDLNGKDVASVLRSDMSTQAIPIHLISAMDDLPDLSHYGVIGQLVKPISKNKVLTIIEQLKMHGGQLVKLLLIEDDVKNIVALRTLLKKEKISLTVVETGKKAFTALKEQSFSAVIMDLGLPDMTGFELLDLLIKDPQIELPPVIVHTGQELSDEEYAKLQSVTEKIVIKSETSPERLLDEVHLFINSVTDLEEGESIESINIDDLNLAGKVVLLVDDDMRNTFALAKVLRKKDLIVHIAPSAKEGLLLLEKHSEIDIVLMDIMMPEMDGYEAIDIIRQQASYAELPIIALTAKTMKGDKEKCLDAGANDYLAKPVDIQKLLLMMQIWV